MVRSRIGYGISVLIGKFCDCHHLVVRRIVGSAVMVDYGHTGRAHVEEDISVDGVAESQELAVQGAHVSDTILHFLPWPGGGRVGGSPAVGGCEIIEYQFVRALVVIKVVDPKSIVGIELRLCV